MGKSFFPDDGVNAVQRAILKGRYRRRRLVEETQKEKLEQREAELEQRQAELNGIFGVWPSGVPFSFDVWQQEDHTLRRDWETLTKDVKDLNTKTDIANEKMKQLLDDTAPCRGTMTKKEIIELEEECKRLGTVNFKPTILEKHKTKLKKDWQLVVGGSILTAVGAGFTGWMGAEIANAAKGSDLAGENAYVCLLSLIIVTVFGLIVFMVACYRNAFTNIYNNRPGCCK